MGHVDGTLQKLVLQCAAISNTDFNLPTKMTEKIIFKPNEHLQTQSKMLSKMYSTQERKQQKQNEKKTSATTEMYTECGKDTKTTSSTRKFGSNLSLKKTSNNDKNLQCKKNIINYSR